MTSLCSILQNIGFGEIFRSLSKRSNQLGTKACFQIVHFWTFLVDFWKLLQRIVETDEKKAENSRAWMPAVKQTRLRKVFGQVQYQAKGSKKDNLPEYGSQKASSSQSDQNPNISLSDITYLKPKTESIEIRILEVWFLKITSSK